MSSTDDPCRGHGVDATKPAERAAPFFTPDRSLSCHAGNIGAVCWGAMFYLGYLDRLALGYEHMGYAVVASSLLSGFVRVRGAGSLCGNEAPEELEGSWDRSPPLTDAAPVLAPGDVDLE